MEIALAEKEDIDGILPLQEQIYRISEPAEGARQMLEELIAADNCNILVAKIDNKVVGTGVIFYLPIPAHGKQAAFLEGIVVDEAYRGKGVGTALAQKFIELAKVKNCYKIVFTSSDKRADVHKFYENLGFSKWGFEFRMDLD